MATQYDAQIRDYTNNYVYSMDYKNQNAPVVLTVTSDWTKEPNNNGVPDTATYDMIEDWTKEQIFLAQNSRQEPNLDLNFDVDSPDCIQLIGGLDISFAPKNKIDCVICLSVIHYPTMKVVFEAYKMAKLSTPYKPGFLDFREVPLYIALLDDVYKKYPQYMPQLLMVDGNGTLHHRKCGAAVHLGVKTNIPCMGVAKTLLCVNGISHEQVDSAFQGSDAKTAALLMTDAFCAAKAIRNSATEPTFYISPGHRMSLDQAVNIALYTIKNRGEGPYPVDSSDDLGRIFLKQKYHQL